MRKLFLVIPTVLLALPILHAQIDLRWEGNDLIAYSIEKADEGYVGCHADELQMAIPYHFILERAEKNHNCTNCGSLVENTCLSTFKKYRIIQTEDREVRFSALPQGEYRVLCKVAKAKGCNIQGLNIEEKSIIYFSSTSDTPKLLKSITQKGAVLGSTGEISVFPNPFYDSFTISIQTVKAQPSQIKVVNALGQVLTTKEVLLNEGVNYLEIGNTDFFSSGGLWVIWVEESGEVHHTQIAKINK